MKRWLAMILVLALLGCAALAEAQTFSIRNGVAWGMTQAEVLAAEGNPKHELENGQNGQVKLELEDLQTPGGEADLDYLFAGDALVAIKYEFDAEETAPDAITGALDAKYGARGNGDEGRFSALMRALSGDGFALNTAPRQGDFLYDWAAEDVYIVMTNRLSDDGDDIDLFYFDEQAILAAADSSVSESAPALNPNDF